MPDTGIEQYPGAETGASGYLFNLGGGVKQAVVLWQDVLSVTESGDIAPGLGGFTAEAED